VSDAASPDHEIVYLDPHELTYDPLNSRKHSDEQIDKIRGSIREFKFGPPILLKRDGKTIGIGEARCRAAILEGLQRVPTITLAHLTDLQWRAFAIADNQLATEAAGASWNMETLASEIESLKALDFDISLLGFDAIQIAGITAQPMTAAEHWAHGMPGYNNEDQGPFRTLFIHFKSQADVDAFAKKLRQSITDKTKYLWFPEQEYIAQKDKQFVSE
jgi:hypothetical protein